MIDCSGRLRAFWLSSRPGMGSAPSSSALIPLSSWSPWMTVGRTSISPSSRPRPRACSATASASPPLVRLGLILESCSLPLPLREPRRGTRYATRRCAPRPPRGPPGRAEGGREAFDASEDRNRALAFCWVSTGSALKHYEQMTGVPQGRHRCRRRSGSVIALPISVSTSWTSTSSGRPASGMLHYFCGS